MLWKMLDTFQDRKDALQLKATLKAAGINAFVETKEHRTSLNGYGQTAWVKRVYVFVESEKLDEATKVQGEL